MKRKLTYTVILSLITFFPLCSLGQVPFNWIIDEMNPGEDIVLLADESLFTDGTRSCHLQLISNRVPYLYSEVFYVSPGSEYSFSIDVFDPDTAGQVKIYADFLDAYGFDIFGAPPVFSRDSMEWQTISWSGSVPDQAVVGYVLVKFYCQPSLYSFNREANIWIDNARFIQSGQNLILNGSFEQWLVDVKDLNLDQKDLIVYPNPSGTNANIKLNDGIGRLLITDLAGRVILFHESVAPGLFSIDVSRYPEGVYLISAQDRSGGLHRGKLVVSR